MPLIRLTHFSLLLSHPPHRTLPALGRQPSLATLASIKQLPSSRIPLQSAYAWVPACSVVLSVVVPETLGILCLYLSQPLASVSHEKVALWAVALPGAPAPFYNIVAIRDGGSQIFKFI